MKIVFVRMKIFLDDQYDSLSEEEKQELLKEGISRVQFTRNKMRELQQSFKGVSDHVMLKLWESYGLPYDVYLFFHALESGEMMFGDSLDALCSDSGIDPEDIIGIGEKFPLLNLDTPRMKRELGYAMNESNRLTGNYIEEREKSDEAVDTRNGFINPNWFLYDIDAESAAKLWGPEKTKYIFGKYFLNGITKTEVGKQVVMPEFYNFSIFRVKVTDGEDTLESGRKSIDVLEHVFEWGLPEDFSQADFSRLAS